MQVLDHGYVKKIEHWGADESIIEAARMSTNKGFLGWGPYQCECVDRSPLPGTPTWAEAADPTCIKCKGTGARPGDEKLLKYLYDHKHMTPFEMAGLVIEVQAPIFVFREWHRHRTQSYNELSARYTPLPDVNYLPTIERLLTSDSTNKQASSTGGALDTINASDFRRALEKQYEEAQLLYQLSLNMGVPKELARLIIPVGRYSRMRASANLRNWLAFLTLRMDPAAQWEIQQYAHAVGQIIQEIFPRTWDLFSKNSIFPTDFVI